MLRSCSKDDFYKLIDFAYALASDLTKSGYPTYCDGVKTKEMFVSRSLKAFDRETEQMLLFEQDGEILGLIHCYWFPEDRYLDTCFFLTERETQLALSEFLGYARGQFPGYDLYLGFPAENRAAVEFLAGHGFECIENDWNNTAFPDRLGDFPENPGIRRIGRQDYHLFETLHRQIDGDMYWNSERILSDLENWVILLKERDGKPLGAVYYMDEKDGWLEIFGIDTAQEQDAPALYRELLPAALSDAKKRNATVMTFFCEEEYEQIAKECGFVCVGNYLCHKIHLE